MTKKRRPATADQNTFGKSFSVTLMKDVLLSMERLEGGDTQASRRDLIRTMFAAIEGYVWQYREHVRDLAENVSDISPVMAFALDEVTYGVSETGKLITQKRFVSMTAMIRLVTRLAEANSTGLKVDFTEIGWSHLKEAITVRNRITHPKSNSDFVITDRDIEISQSGLFWLLDMVAIVLRSVNDTSAEYLSELKILVAELKSGDPTALADYRRAIASL